MSFKTNFSSVLSGFSIWCAQNCPRYFDFLKCWQFSRHVTECPFLANENEPFKWTRTTWRWKHSMTTSFWHTRNHNNKLRQARWRPENWMNYLGKFSPAFSSSLPLIRATCCGGLVNNSQLHYRVRSLFVAHTINPNMAEVGGGEQISKKWEF